MLNRCVVSNFPVHFFFCEALFDNGDFFAAKAVEGVDKLVNLGLFFSSRSVLDVVVSQSGKDSRPLYVRNAS